MVEAEQLEPAVSALQKTGLRVERPPEDWLVKVYDGEVLVDLVHNPNNRPVTADLLARTDELPVDSVYMPVLGSTDLMVTKLLAFDEQSCDFGKALPHARALREQVDWAEVRREVSGSPYAVAFLFLLECLAVLEPVEGSTRTEKNR